MRVSKKTAVITICSALFFITFYIAVENVCERFHFVQGYDRCSAPNFITSFVFLVIASSISFILPRRNNPSSVLIWTIYFMHVFGAIALLPFFVPSLAINDFLFVLIVFLGYVMTAWLVSNVSIKIKFVTVSPTAVFLILSAALLATLIIIINTFGVKFKFASFFDVYDVRAAFKEEMQFVAGPIIGYAILLTAFFLSPLNIVCGLSFRGESKLISCFMLLLGVFGTSQIFAVAAFKSSVAIVAISVPLSLIIGTRNNPFSRFLVVLASVIIALLLIQSLNLNQSALDHWFRRVFIGPGMNAIYYYEEFGFFHTGSGAAAPLQISQDYYGTTGSANSGIFGNGFAKGGVIGVLSNLMILVVYCLLLDAAGKFVPPSVSFPLAFIIGYAFSNSAATTVLASYGGILLIMALYLMSSSLKHRRADIAGKVPPAQNRL